MRNSFNRFCLYGKKNYFFFPYNLSIRSLDSSYPEEEGLTGSIRGFYPLQDTSVKGNYKIPSSEVLNEGYSATVGEKLSFTLPDVPYIKNRYDT